MQPSITPEQYAQHRDHLAALLEEAAGLPKLLPESAERIAQARTKLLENEFVFTLVGEFQGGKSTTFNLLAGGGRELSPRGKNGGGIKTSGCIVRAVPLSDPNEPEHALVTWRTPEEIFMGFSGLLRESLSFSDLEGETRKANDKTPDETRSELLSVFNPATQEGRTRIREKAQEVWRDKKESFLGIQPEILDQIRFALLTAHFYGKKETHNQLKKTRISLAEVRKLIVFPEDWEVRWTQEKPDAFAVAEICFAFVKEIQLRIDAPDLAKLGCSIVDCPGLGVSAWDNFVAQQAISNADAVFYLVSGDKALNLGELTQLRQLASVGSRVFLAPNNRILPWQQAERVTRETLAKLANSGIPFAEERFQPFSALLALHGKQLERLMPGLPAATLGLDPDTIAALDADVRAETDSKQPLPPATIAEELRWRIKQMCGIYRGSRPTELSDADLISTAQSLSRFNPLLEKVQAFVLNNRALGILGNNAEKAAAALQETEGNLKSAEKSARQRREECEEQFRNAELVLRAYEDGAASMLSCLTDDGVGDLAKSFSDQLTRHKNKAIDKIVEKVSKRLEALLEDKNKFEQFKKHFQLIFSKPGTLIDSAAQMEIQGYLEQWIQLEVGVWMDLARNRMVPTYTSSVENPVRLLRSGLEGHWQRSVANKQLPILEDILFGRLDYQSNFSFQDGTNSIEKIINSALNKRNRDEKMNVIGLVVLAAIGAFLLGPLALAALPIAAPILRKFGIGAGEESFKPVMKKSLDAEFPKIIEEQQKIFVGIFRDYMASLRSHIDREVIQHPRRVYEQRKSEAKATFDLAEHDRLRLAEEAKEVRETKFVPLRHRIREFEAALAAQFGSIRA